MSKKLLIFSVMFCLFITIRSDDSKKNIERTSSINFVEIFPTNKHYAHQYIFLFSGVVILAIVRHIIKSYEFPIPYSIFCIFIGIIWGIGALYNNWMERMAYISMKILRSLQFIYLPALVFGTAFTIDVHAFLKSLPQILIISLPVGLLSAFGTGLVMTLVIDSDSWSHTDALLFGTVFLAVYPMHVLRLLKASTFETKHVRILLEGEALITASWTLTVHKFLLGHLNGWTVWWYQYLMGVTKTYVFGIPLSYWYGLIGTSLIKLAYNDAVGLMLLTISMCYATYFLMRWIANAGIVGTVVVGVVMGLERASLSKEMEKQITYLWEVATCIINGIIFINVGVVTPKLLQSGISFQEFILVFVTYLIANISRFLSFLLFSSVLSRIGYGMSFQNMFICVWSGVKNPICLNLAIHLLEGQFKEQEDKARLFFLHTVSVFILMLLINGSLLPVLMKTLGLTEISLSKLINMNNCMKYIYEARARTVAILKMDRFLADANWPLVVSSTCLTHPYKKANQQIVESSDKIEEDEYFLGNKFTFCPDCQKDIPNEPTPKEIKEMTQEAKLRLLKLKKTAFSRLYENGMMSQEGIRIMHQALEIAMDTEDLIIVLDGLLKLFTKEGIFYRWLRNRLQSILKNRDESYKPPRKQWRLWCYRIVNKGAFYIFIHSVVVVHMTFTFITLGSKKFRDFTAVVNHGQVVFFVIYLIEFLLKLFALSWIYICKHGFRNYFRSYFNIVEFIILWLTLVSAIFQSFVLNFVSIPDIVYLSLVIGILLAIRILRLCSFCKFYACCKTFSPAVIKYLDAKVDRHRALAFELGKNYIAAEEEILENLQHIVDNDKIRESIKERIENDRLAVTKRLGIAQKESPGVATTVKTILAMRTVLNSMREDAHELRISGWVDDVESGKLLKSLAERYKFINTIKTIQPSSPKLIFREVPYMGDNDELIEFLYTNVYTKKFHPGEVVYREGEVVEGIYILINGMFMVTYTPKVNASDKLKEIGALPVVDHVCSLTYEEPLCDYMVPGNTIGELSILTDRPYDGVVTAETQSQVYVLTKNILEKAFEMDADPVNGLQCRIWKYLGFRKALTVMMNTPCYRSYTQDKIKYILERSFTPDLSNYKVFVVNDMMEDIILIEGVVVDFNTKDIYTGPCYIPRAVQRLVLPKSSLINLNVTLETKLLIVPAKDYDEYEIMMTEEETCQLVNDDTSQCLRHFIQDKASVGSKASRQFKGVTSVLRKRLLAVASNKSKISFEPSKTSKPSKITLRTL